MVRTHLFSALALTAMMCGGARAQEPPAGPPPGDPPPRDAAERDVVPNPAVAQFDANGDGQLGVEELGRAREFMQALRQGLGDRLRERDGDRPRPRRDRPDAPPRPGGPAEELSPPPGPGPDAGRPPQPPRDGERGPMATFERFDANRDGQLSRDEFLGFWNTMRDRPGPFGPREQAFGRPMGPRRGDRDGDRGARGEDRRPREAGREGDRPRDGEPRAGRRDRRPRRDGGTELDEAPPFRPDAPPPGPPVDGSAAPPRQ